MSPEQIVDIQLEHYNSRHLEKFVATYSPNIQIFRQGESQPFIEGQNQLKEAYRTLFTRAGLHAKIVKRMIMGNKVIDQEEVTSEEHPNIYAIAIYEVKEDLIQRVWFIKPE